MRLNLQITAFFLIVGVLALTLVLQADAIVGPTITTKQTFSNGLGTVETGDFDTVWSNTTHSIMLTQSAGILYRYVYSFSADTLTTTSATVSNGLRICNQGNGVSAVQNDKTVFVGCKVASSTSAVVAKYNITSSLMTKIQAANVTLGGTGQIPQDAEISRWNVYLAISDGSAAPKVGNLTKALTGFVVQTAAQSNWEVTNQKFKIVVYSGVSSASTDIVYGFGIQSELELFRMTAGATTSNGTCETAHAAIYFVVYPLFDRTLLISKTNTYEVLKTGVTCTAVYTTEFASRQIQAVSISGSEHTYSSTIQNTLMNSTQAIGYIPSTSASERIILYTETVNNSTGIIRGIDEPKFYILNSDHYVSSTTSTGVTWIVKEITDKSVEINVVGYEENLSVPLIEDNTFIWEDNLQIQCDFIYTLPNPKLYLKTVSDCIQWHIIDVTPNDIGREIPFLINADLVHTEEYTNYQIHVRLATGDAEDFYVKVLYQGTLVDQNTFDTGDNTQVRLLYGQCYTIQYVESISSEVVTTSTICADDVIFKEDVILSDLGFTFWSAQWGGSHTWDSDTNILTTLVHHNDVPYNYTIQITNSTDDLIIDDLYTNVASELDSNTYNLTAYDGQGPFQLKYFNEDGKRFYHQYFDFEGNWFAPITTLFDDSLGTFGGWGLLMFIPILFAAIFTRNTAALGGGMFVAMLGVLIVFGVLTLNEGAIVLITFVALVGLLAYRIIS